MEIKERERIKNRKRREMENKTDESEIINVISCNWSGLPLLQVVPNWTLHGTPQGLHRMEVDDAMVPTKPSRTNKAHVPTGLFRRNLTGTASAKQVGSLQLPFTASHPLCLEGTTPRPQSVSSSVCLSTHLVGPSATGPL